MHGLLLIDDDDPVTGAQDRLQDEVSGWVHGRTLREPVPTGQLDATGSPATGRSVRELHRRELVLDHGDVVRSASGLWLTSRARTMVDCAALLTPEALVCLLDDALHRGLLSRELLEQAVSDRHGDPGVRALRRALALSDGRAESPTETLARLLLQPRLPRLVPQVQVRDVRGRIVARLDLGDEELRLGVELDGRRAHAGDAMLARDRRRDRRTAALGWWTERATWWEVRCQSQDFVARITAVARARPAGP